MTASHPDSARARAPGSVGNIGVGFDLLGHAVDGIGDVATVRRIDAHLHFGASVDACLFVMTFQPGASSKECSDYDSLQSAENHRGRLAGDPRQVSR